MKIEGYQGTNNIYGDQAAKFTKNTQLAASKNQTNKNSTEESTSIELSERAQQIMQGQVEPEIDLKKVASLKSAINSGNYKISADDIAKRMMAQVDMQKED
ncbi:MAG: flagellar biosynthesis anti-sigma factor FlgM [Liquorilactobacillus sp.]|uniref:flagellar biosynthesis anti-sigma factor FlgM n=1 Tax=Liquorilactobacillus sp. TaxID=2767923 RepID=UPI0039E9E0D7